ncbi:MAG: sugar phosphate nucleotidyltransferase [Promethearchaeota archaeon]
MWIVCPIAGVGKRLQPFTYSKPRTFLKIAGSKVIDHILIKLKKTFPKGTTICFIVGYKKRQTMDYLIKHYSDYFNLEFKVQKPRGYEADTPYFSGLGDAILLAKDLVNNDDCFILLSDMLPMEDYSSILLKFHQGDCDGVINVKKVKNPEYYGVTLLDDKKEYITRIIEKPKEYISHYGVCGAYILSKLVMPRLIDLLEEQSKIELDNGEEHEFTPILDQLIDEGYKFSINEMKEEILDFGRPEGLLEGNQYLLSEMRVQGPRIEELIQSGNIVDSKIVSPVYIGENVEINNSVIGPNVSIGDDVHLHKCVISESVIGDGAHLNKIITSNSIIGDYSVLEDLIKKEITIGDSSYIATSDMRSF